MERYSIPKLVALRWRIDIAGKRPIFGAWSSDVVTTFPYRGDTKILRVSIEASHLQTGEIRTLAYCPGAEWQSVRWLTTAPLLVGQMKLKGRTTCPGTVHGLQLVTKLEIATVFVDGKVRKEPNRESRKSK